jgi:hypothetical protein
MKSGLAGVLTVHALPLHAKNYFWIEEWRRLGGLLLKVCGALCDASDTVLRARGTGSLEKHETYCVIKLCALDGF